MNNPYTHLTIFEREKIYLWPSQKISLIEIARRLNRSPSTISRELRRNKKSECYSPSIAQTKYENRKKLWKNTVLSKPKLWKQVRHLFVGLQWSPEQIFNRLKLGKAELQISYSTIYRAICKDVFEREKRSHGNRAETGAVASFFYIRLRNYERVCYTYPARGNAHFPCIN
ncbi:transposase [Lactococcus lactis]|uniref:transposase n=1 Tax=Lactococcus lactis TaxID=1358 RepID=UPI003C6D1C32